MHNCAAGIAFIVIYWPILIRKMNTELKSNKGDIKMGIFFKIVGALGLILISAGILTKRRKTQDIYYIFGGVCLEVYSISLGDLVFILLQIIFTLSAIYDLIKIGLIKQNDQICAKCN